MYSKGKRFSFREKGIKKSLVYAETEDKLNDIISEYITALSTKRSDACVEYANRIKSVMRRDMTLDVLVEIAPVDSRP
jgi:hypothetical protein